MRHRKSRIITVAIGAVAVIAAGVMLWHNRPQPHKPHPKEIEWAERAASSIRSAPLARADDRSALADTFDSADSFHPEGLDESVRSALFQTFADLIELRSIVDADGYAMWMLARGCRFRDASEPRMKLIFQHYAGREIRQDDADLDIFRLFFESTLLFENGLTQPVGIASGSNVMEVHFGRLRRMSAGAHQAGIDIQRAFDGAPMNNEWFVGDIITGFQCWIPPISIEELVERDGEVLCARMLVGLRTKSGKAIPTEMVFFHDPRANVWFLTQMMYRNVYGVESAGMVY